ncbi:MAG: DUF2470 domain-containing protein [Cyanothece sp. SIO1E1]|nr:DUF2470 domain-containing protein [Cyanothece sp. SIO1E1]
MSEQITAAVSDRICQHMNEDHAEAVVLYAKTFGNVTEATTASMISIDTAGMNLMTQVNGANLPLRIEFDHALEDAEDAHQTLISMVKQARQQHK